MANALYQAYKRAALGNPVHSLVDFDAPDDIRIILIDAADYTVDLTNHQDLADVAGAARVATVALTGEAILTAGAFDSDNATFSAVSGDQSEAIIGYKHTGTEGTSPLIWYFDTFSSGMPVTPNGGDITVTVNASGWFSF